MFLKLWMNLDKHCGPGNKSWCILGSVPLVPVVFHPGSHEVSQGYPMVTFYFQFMLTQGWGWEKGKSGEMQMGLSRWFSFFPKVLLGFPIACERVHACSHRL